MPEVVVRSRSDPSLTVPDIETKREELAKIPGAAEVINADSYKRGRATTIRDALDFAPGVFVQPRFGAEEARISIRGSGIQRTFHGRGIQLLQDDVPLNLADGSFDFQATRKRRARIRGKLRDSVKRDPTAEEGEKIDRAIFFTTFAIY